MKHVFLVLVLFAFLMIPFVNTYAAKGNLSAKTGLERLGVADTDQPFNTTAIIEGSCRDADIPKSDSKGILGLYKMNKDFGNETFLHRVGLLYHNNRGQEAICIDDGAIDPMFLKNVDHEMVFTVGRTTLGKYYGIDQDKIIVVDSMERLEEAAR